MAIRGAPAVAERALFAEYPFLPGAEALIQAFSPSLRDLLSDPTYERSRELGRARVRAAADDPAGTRALEEIDVASQEERFLSFLYARLLLATLPNVAPLRRWAVAEAKRSSARLDRVSPLLLIDIANRLGFRFEREGARFSLPLADYVKLATPIREGDFRLIHQAVVHGRVLVTKERATRLLQEGIRVRLSQNVLSLGEDLATSLRETEAGFLADLRARLPSPTARAATGVVRLKPEIFPPCVRKMRRMLQEGENLSHSGRFALAAFLYRAGADADTIGDQYRGAPDFDEGITRYQVEHITSKDGGRGYEPPECETLRAHGLCFREGDPAAAQEADRRRDPLCFEPFLRHPLQYYKERGGAVVDRGEPDGPTAGARPR
jgi:DNA primase large subunit